MKNNLSTSVYNSAGKSLRTLELPENLFGVKWNADMMHQVVTGMQSNQRAGTAHTKGRGEVRGGGKKPWRQKGTGRARHGSSRSPIWRGGGITHGPIKDRDFEKKINKKTRQKALFMALSEKFRTGKMLFVDSLLSSGKTKQVVDSLKSLQSVSGFETLCTKKANNILVLSGTMDATTKRAFKNIPFATIDPAIGANALDVMQYRYILVAQPDEAITSWAGKGATRTASIASSFKAKAKEVKPVKEKKAKTEKKTTGRTKKVTAKEA